MVATGEGKLYLCAIKDVYSGRIVGHSIDERMKASLAVTALHNAIALLSPAGTVVHSDRGSQFRSNASIRTLRNNNLVGSMGRVGATTTPPWSRSSPCCRRTSSTGNAGPPATNSA
jgi:putative transposase